MTFRFGKRSRREQQGQHPDLIELENRTLENSPVDFGVFDGIRTAREQNQLYQRGASRIDGYWLIGKHQKQWDGFCHAGDLVPWLNGRFVWDWDAIYLICETLVEQARILDVPIRWGGCWGHVPINDLAGSPENWVAEYVKRKLEAGKRAFNDGPHYELFGDKYKGKPK